MKRISLIILFVSAFLCFYESAWGESVKIEAENYSSCSGFKPIILSGKAPTDIMRVASPYVSGKEYSVSYEFDAPESGGYNFIIEGCDVDSLATSGFYYRINNGKKIYAADNFKKIKKLGEGYDDSDYPFYESLLGTAELSAGENKIEFFINEPAEYTVYSWQTPYCLFYMDSFVFEKNSFEFENISCGNGINVFEAGEEVVFNIRFRDYIPAQNVYSYEVENIYHQTVKKGKLQSDGNITALELNLGNLPLGWYKIFLSENGAGIAKTQFSVVRNLSEYPENNEISTGFVSYSLSGGLKSNIVKYARAIKHAGINTVRETYFWPEWQQTKERFYRTSLRYYQDIIADCGLKSINFFHDTPSWAENSGFLSKNLFDVYEFQKDYASYMKDKVEVMEIWNEEDVSYASETADAYAAFFKAASLGAEDGAPGMKKAFGGFAASPGETDYMDIFMLNGIKEYTDIYNYHLYSKSEGYPLAPFYNRESLKAHRDIVAAYGFNKEVWLTEGGYAAKDGSEGERLQQARAAVVNSVESFANGTDRHFWFIIPPYRENDKEYGTFYSDYTPAPAYSALANAVYFLGGRKYAGKLKKTDDGINAYVFNNDENSVVVLWAESEGYAQLKTDKSLRVYDMVGGETVFEPLNGAVNIRLGGNPLYAVFDEPLPEEEYYAQSKTKGSETNEKSKPGAAERLVLQPCFEEKSEIMKKRDGYYIAAGELTKVSLKIYNFSDEPRSGEITAKISDGFFVENSQSEFSVQPWKSTELFFNIGADGVDKKGFLSFGGISGGYDISKCTSAIYSSGGGNTSVLGYFENSAAASGWNCDNAASGTSGSASSSADGVKFSYSGSGWFYPMFKVSESDELLGSDGFSWEARGDNMKNVSMLSTVYMKDGRKFFEGDINAKSVGEKWRRFYINWEDLHLTYCPPGADADKKFDVSDVDYIAVGINMRSGAADYSIKNVAYFRGTYKAPSFEKLKAEGAEDGKTYLRGKAPVVYAKLPEDSVSAAVYLNGAVFSGAFVDNGCIYADLSSVEPGGYSVLLCSENEFGYIQRDSIDFYVY